MKFNKNELMKEMYIYYMEHHRDDAETSKVYDEFMNLLDSYHLDLHDVLKIESKMNELRALDKENTFKDAIEMYKTLTK